MSGEGILAGGVGLEPDLVTLAECPPGLFRFGDTLGFKAEYGAMQTIGPRDVPGDQIRWTVGRWPDAYCVSSGEYFWGGAKTQEARAALMVEPVDLDDLLAATPTPRGEQR